MYGLVRFRTRESGNHDPLHLEFAMSIRKTLVAPVLGLVLAGVALAPKFTAESPDSNQLAKAQMEAARRTYELTWTRAEMGEGGDAEQVYQWSVRWLEAQRDLSGTKAGQLAALEAHQTRMQRLERRVAAMVKAGQGRQSEGTAAEYYRLEADLWLARAKAK
jgi:hypothetical protein